MTDPEVIVFWSREWPRPHRLALRLWHHLNDCPLTVVRPACTRGRGAGASRNGDAECARRVGNARQAGIGITEPILVASPHIRGQRECRFAQGRRSPQESHRCSYQRREGRAARRRGIEGPDARFSMTNLGIGGDPVQIGHSRKVTNAAANNVKARICQTASHGCIDSSRTQCSRLDVG